MKSSSIKYYGVNSRWVAMKDYGRWQEIIDGLNLATCEFPEMGLLAWKQDLMFVRAPVCRHERYNFDVVQLGISAHTRRYKGRVLSLSWTNTSTKTPPSHMIEVHSGLVQVEDA